MRFQVDSEVGEIFRVAVLAECQKIAALYGQDKTGENFIHRLAEHVLNGLPKNVFKGEASTTGTLGIAIDHLALRRHVALCASEFEGSRHKVIH